MQNIATGKSELAALPLAFSAEPSAVIENTSEFRSFLQDASDKAFTLPVGPKSPETKDENTSSGTGSDQLELQNLDGKIEIEQNRTSGKQATSELTGQQIEPDKNQQNLQEINFELIEVQTEQQPVLASLPVEDIDAKNSPNDLATDFESVIPSIDILELLEQSQFREITISQGEKAVNEGQINGIHGVVEYLKTVSAQATSAGEGDSAEMLQQLDKFITAFKEQIFESESPVNLAELLSKIQSDEESKPKAKLELELELELEPELESKVVSLPTNTNDVQLALDVELLSVVIAKDQTNTKTDDAAETTHQQIAEGLLTGTQEVLADPTVKTTNFTLEDDISEELFVSTLEDSETVKLTDEIDNMLAAVAPKEILIAAKAPDEKNILNTAGDSKDIQQLFALSPEKLEKALENLTERLFQTDTTVKNSSESQTKIAGSIKQDFIASLKTSIEDAKVQVNLGKQNDFDLNSIVVDNLNRISQDINPESVSATISRFNQTLELSSSLLAHRAASSASSLEASNVTGVMDRVLIKENQSQSNLLQTKQTQQQAVTFEKAVNIVRSEGHQQLVEKVRWMVNQNNLQADIRLDPPDLGAMKVRVSLNGETASVNIAVQSQQAKDLLDSAAPKLRELLEEQGIQLGQSSVEQEQHQKDHNHANFVRGNSELIAEKELQEANQVTEQVIVNGRLSGIDYFV